MSQRWLDRLAGVDVFAEDHLRTALVYVRWDDPHPPTAIAEAHEQVERGQRDGKVIVVVGG